ncbi:MAG: HAMP domain-containing histidine kinase [Ruminococcus sp.]|nr:HAMP domain-containing histidine kinase [Ruminococcus sp.]
MKNKKSSYYKLLVMTMFIIISLISLLGVLTVSLSSAIYRNTELEQLNKTGDILISCFKDQYYSSDNIYDENISSLCRSFGSNGNYSVYLYDENGNNIAFKDDNSVGDMTLSSSMISRLDEKDFLGLDSIHISQQEPYMLYATQFFAKNQDNVAPRAMYAAFYQRSDSLNSFTIKVTIAYAILGIIGAVLAYLLLNRKTKRLAAYEYDFMRISEMYAKGDFSETISTTVPGTNKEIAEYVNAIAANVASSEETSKTFIANVSHELRTPMTTIGGFVDGILDGTIPKSRQNEYLILVSKEIKRLRILISSMLNMSRFESGTLSPNFKETNLTDLVIQTVLMFEKKIDDKHLEVEGLGSARIDAEVDADLIQQVIYNLVENAVKFINERGTLSFRFEKLNGMVTIGIKNTGEGLTNEEITQVFDRFYKTDSSRGKDTTGLGLGLSISRKIVHLHDGHIVVKSVYNEYTEFLVEIPEKRNSVKKG